MSPKQRIRRPGIRTQIHRRITPPPILRLTRTRVATPRRIRWIACTGIIRHDDDRRRVADGIENGAVAGGVAGVGELPAGAALTREAGVGPVGGHGALVGAGGAEETAGSDDAAAVAGVAGYGCLVCLARGGGGGVGGGGLSGVEDGGVS